MSKLLLDESPLIILPGLAVKVGLNEAIVLQQIHYWLQSKNSGSLIDDEKWIYNSVREWTEQFPFWSEATVKRSLSNLREKGYLIADSLSRDGRDKTLYYRIDYSKFNEPMHLVKLTQSVGHIEPMTNSTETTTDTKSEIAKQAIEYLNKKVSRSYRLSTVNLELVNARVKDGATLADLKKVIDTKASQWLNDKTMNQYLRPATLFNRNKFEQYIAESPNSSRDDEFGMML